MPSVGNDLISTAKRIVMWSTFRLQDGTPLSRSLLVTWLKQNLAAAGIDSSRFSGHSYRIGAATTAASKGVGDATIQT